MSERLKKNPREEQGVGGGGGEIIKQNSLQTEPLHVRIPQRGKGCARRPQQNPPQPACLPNMLWENLFAT